VRSLGLPHEHLGRQLMERIPRTVKQPNVLPGLWAAPKLVQLRSPDRVVLIRCGGLEIRVGVVKMPLVKVGGQCGAGRSGAPQDNAVTQVISADHIQGVCGGGEKCACA
jgi:hypothetical protein